jgi:hypothetical protein
MEIINLQVVGIDFDSFFHWVAVGQSKLDGREENMGFV